MGSWTHKPEKRQAMKEDRQAARRAMEDAVDEPVIRTDGGAMTMAEMYGDGSDHEACQDCGMCKRCGGCECSPA